MTKKVTVLHVVSVLQGITYVYDSSLNEIMKAMLTPGRFCNGLISTRAAFHKNITEAAVQRCSQKKLFRKYVANLQDNTHAEV